ncbi:nitroreductase family deazaflavin-dependent oxidoreductase [Cellulomonas chengniuliangii]|uniref:Nitroreductase family deazaflavin-dependent oxidoreductase n=1 Tax=Cellulomonas chengniuliangii TaxID=2968084 RepID=A0ABY5KXT4_9CELL|nr:nitroreductase family deazaflavin-dependent oxidoreductase [Cellulomonas chengniuliangii]MCC2309190.1 nitroreductase family deazaflavin-dependent oxidoreductase [Cellulomonas chengniuliangii]MCC2318534.1 nitroreductase family deazaflavin-dependent oxidoreductase [Cellulomonas chengniuliangii]UUI75229.1 nitroreductase family deazaflavin-dependent oxidoreductase [Cellulomonas chengniuliangii]
MSPSPSSPPTGWRRWFYRAPLGLYRRGLGGMLGSGFVLLTHRGRVTGEPRQAVLEIVEREESGAITVVAGFGPRTDWYRNVQAHPEVTVQIGKDERPARAAVLGPDEAADRMAALVATRPRTARRIARAVGESAPTDLAPEAADQRWRDLGARTLFVRFDPV